MFSLSSFFHFCKDNIDNNFVMGILSNSYIKFVSPIIWIPSLSFDAGFFIWRNKMPHKNPEQIKKYYKIYSKEYYEKNKEKIKKRNLERYYEKNQNSKQRKFKKETTRKTKEEIAKQRKEYREKNKEKIREYSKKYKIRKRKEPIFRIRKALYNRLRYSVVSKSGHTMDLLGCDINFFLQYLESKFQSGMSWENYGIHGWHIDHIRPCASFNLLNEDEQKACFHYTNLQPLWAEDNLKKSNKLIGGGPPINLPH